MKICSKCTKEYPKTFFHRNSKAKDGLSVYCKHCARIAVHQWSLKNPDKVSNKKKRYYIRHKEILAEKRKKYEMENSDHIKSLRRKYARRNKVKSYGITMEIFDSILKKQEFRCAICRKLFENKTPLIDHCHKTGNVRGLLCTACNFSLGHLEKDGFIEKAIAYLGNNEKW